MPISRRLSSRGDPPGIKYQGLRLGTGKAALPSPIPVERLSTRKHRVSIILPAAVLTIELPLLLETTLAAIVLAAHDAVRTQSRTDVGNTAMPEPTISRNTVSPALKDVPKSGERGPRGLAFFVGLYQRRVCLTGRRQSTLGFNATDRDLGAGRSLKCRRSASAAGPER